jgi:plastocyanin
MKNLCVFIFVAASGLCPLLPGATLEATIKDGKGGLVSDAVVYAEKAGAAALAKKKSIIDQRDQQFVPYVTALQVGTTVIFPNSDNIRHHVYSLSPAKKFDLPLYSGIPADPVLFDKVGFVTLGCNIHDWMIAYVAVLPTSHFHVTGQDGHAVLRDLPAGQYTVRSWHPSLKGTPDNSAQSIDLAAGDTKQVAFTLDLKPDFRAKRAPGMSTGGYR